MSRKYRSLEDWRAIIEAQQASGESVVAFCQQQGISPKHFWNRRRAAAGGPTRRVAVQARGSEHGGLEVGVSDTGEGISPELVERLFEPFSSGRKQGMGIGLALCRSIIDNHGGEIWLDEIGPDEAGIATRFCFRLPPAPA